MGQQNWVRRHHAYAVWEITLKCNLACSHCGSRAGEARQDELSTAECLDLVQQMAEAGITEVTLIGGEAFLRRDWLEIAAAITKSGMRATMTTGGFGLSAGTCAKMVEAGIGTVSVSVDGLEPVHDQLRGRPGSWQQCLKSISLLGQAGITVGCNSQINRLSARNFPELYLILRDAGMKAWQLQLTVPMGNAADNSHILLQPAELLVIYPMLARVAQRAYNEGVAVNAGNNIGYYGPFEVLLRNLGNSQGDLIWQGCQAGLSALGIEANGAIKGCPSLPTSAYTGGNIRERKLKDILLNTPELTFNLKEGSEEGTAHLWGFCQGCQFASLCRGGCNWTSHVFFDRRGNNPYCHHRALALDSRGLRERVTLSRKASGLPFDNGCFDLHQESRQAAWPEGDELRLSEADIHWPADWPAWDGPDLEGLQRDYQQRIQPALRIP